MTSPSAYRGAYNMRDPMSAGGSLAWWLLGWELTLLRERVEAGEACVLHSCLPRGRRGQWGWQACGGLTPQTGLGCTSQLQPLEGGGVVLTTPHAVSAALALGPRRRTAQPESLDYLCRSRSYFPLY